MDDGFLAGCERNRFSVSYSADGFAGRIRFWQSQTGQARDEKAGIKAGINSTSRFLFGFDCGLLRVETLITGVPANDIQDDLTRTGFAVACIRRARRRVVLILRPSSMRQSWRCWSSATWPVVPRRSSERMLGARRGLRGDADDGRLDAVVWSFPMWAAIDTTPDNSGSCRRAG